MSRGRLCFFALALCLLASCRRPPVGSAQAPIPRSAGKDKPSLLFQGFSARASHKGLVVWEAKAARARVNHDGLKAHAEVVTVIYFRKGKVVSRARADRADIGLKDFDIVADGSVEVRSSDGVILRTSHLNWENRLQRISSSAPVTVLRGRTKLTGVGFVADRDLRDVRVLHDVKAEALSVRALREESKTWPHQ